MTVERLLDLAEGIVVGLQTAHQARVLHADLSPHNLLVDDQDQVRLVDFGASRVLAGRGAAGAKAVGTLSYVSPELTGRMGRVADGRADLYSLGAIWFHMAAGRPPFQGDTPLDIVHAHIAATPPALQQLRPDLPPWFCRIVDRLLQKAPEERYQSPYGVLRDLRGFRDGSLAPEGALGLDDESDRLQLPERLYERDEQLEQLHRTLKYVGEGAAATLLVQGGAGSGKTALVDRLRQSVVAAEGLFVSGRFTPSRAHHPYSAVRVALDSLALAISSLPEVDPRRVALQDALGANAGVVVELSRGFGTLLGDVPDVPELGPAESVNRLRSTFRSLASACAAPGRPLVLFLDDAQWIDRQSAELLRAVTTVASPGHFLVVVANRPEEVGPEHLLSALQADASVLQTSNLSPSSVQTMIADAIGVLDVRELAAEVHRMTRGNPYFVRSVLHALCDAEALWFDSQSRSWTWDLDRVRAQRLSDNVVDLLTASLRALSGRTRHLVATAAWVGRVSVDGLAAIAGEGLEVVEQALVEATEQGVLVSVDGELHFVDDRVRDAAAEQIDDADRPALHRTIADQLARSLDHAGLEDRALEIVGHLVLASPPVSTEECARDAELYRRAARQTSLAMAHGDTAEYLGRSIELLGGPHGDHDAWFALNLERATSTGWSGDLPTSSAQLDACLDLARTNVERARVKLIRTYQTAQVGQDYPGAVAQAAEALRELGLVMPDITDPESIAHVTGSVQAEYAELMQGRTTADLASLPHNDDPVAQLTMSLLAVGLDCAFIGVPAALPIFVINMVNHSIRHGHTDASSIGFMWFGVVQASARQYALATAFADLAMELHQRRPVARQTPVLLNMLGGFIQHLQVPFVTSTQTCRRTYEIGSQVGEHVYGAYGLVNQNRHLLFSGAALAEVRGGSVHAIGKLEEYGNAAMADLVRVLDGFARALTLDQQESVDDLDHDEFVESAYREAYAPVLVMVALADFYRLVLHVYQGRYDEARQFIEGASSEAMRGQVESSLLAFYGALSLLASYPEEPGDRAEAAEAISVFSAELEELAAQSPSNYGPCAALIRAERARVEGDDAAAEAAYESAIRMAGRSGLHHLRGLAAERAFVHFDARGLTAAARGYFDAAVRAYTRWGATLKVRQLLALRPQWRAAQGTTTRSLDSGSLDTAAINEATRLISSEVELEGFLSRTMSIVLKSAGAQSGILFTCRDGAWWRQAEATAKTVTVTERAMAPDGTFAHTVTDHVLATREAVVLPDPEDADRFSDDPRLVLHRPGSVLCVPLVRRGELTGLIYLEHVEARGAFTRQRVELLETLLAQAAVSLEHAYLHQNLEQMVRERTQALEVARDEAAEAHRNARLVLDTVEQGLVLVRPDGTMLGEHSAAIERWLGPLPSDGSVWSMFEPHDKDFAGLLEVGFYFVDAGLLPREVALASLPRRVDVGERHIELDYHPVAASGDVLRFVLVIATDITAQVVAEAATQEQRDLLAFFTRLTRDPRAVHGFLEEARGLVASVTTGLGTEAEVSRGVHTLKGNCSIFGLTWFARWLHELEDRISEHGGVCSAQDCQALAERWAAVEGRLAPVLPRGHESRVMVDRDRFDEAIRMAESGMAGPQLAKQLREWDWDDVQAHLSRLAEQAEGLAQRLGKSHLRVAVHAPDLRVPPSEPWSRFWNAMVHVVRNAVDHGVDTESERMAAGKPAHASVTLRAARTGSELVIEVEDDGRGVDWERIATRARALGLPDQTPEDRVRALFSDGVSTRSEVTELSGRGVGSAAVWAACERLGGRISITSRSGQGTRIRFVLPAAAPAEPTPAAV